MAIRKHRMKKGAKKAAVPNKKKNVIQKTATSQKTKTGKFGARRSLRLSKKVQLYNISAPKPKIVSIRKPTKKRDTIVKKVADVKIIKKAANVKQTTKRKTRITKTKGKPKGEADVSSHVRKRKHKNDLLVPRDNIQLYDSNPYFFASDPPKFVSVRAFGRVLHRAEDLTELKSYVGDKRRLCKNALSWSFSNVSRLSVLGRAVLTENSKFVDAVYEVCTDLRKENDWQTDRANIEPVLLNEASTGERNYHMLGHATANLEMTRGGREGNNAFLKYEYERNADVSSDAVTFLEKDVSFGVLEHLNSLLDSSLKYLYSSHIYVAVRYGHRKLAAKLIETYSRYCFNDLHIQTLANSTEPLKKFMPVSVLKKGRENRDITPLHTAAINPNVTYLKALMAVEPNFNIPDADNWYTIHYASVCEGSAPLQMILDKGISYMLLNKAKDLPLHCAARAGRTHNVKILLEAIKKVESSAQENERDEEIQSVTAVEGEDVSSVPKKKKALLLKKNTSVINAKAKNGFTPLHFAVVEVLLTDDTINVEVQTSAVHKKLTPLMLACQHGFLEIANLLIDIGGAVIEKGDKLKRTALSHAVINGQTHIVAMLLRRGASPSLVDTSGNSPVHYAAAYGWFECLELLANADPESLNVRNDWHLTPLVVAYLKGHLGIVEWLIDGPYADRVDINCRDQTGRTLIFSLLNHYRILSTKHLLKQLDYLLSKGADCSIKDSSSNGPLHVFVSLKVKLHVEKNLEYVEKEENDQRLTVDEYKRCVDLLLSNGAKISDKNEDGENSIWLALRNGNLLVAEYLLENFIAAGGTLCDFENYGKNATKSSNLLHHILLVPFTVYKNQESWAYCNGPAGGQYNIIPLLKRLLSVDIDRVKIWLDEKDFSGRTPLLLLCENYESIKPITKNSVEADGNGIGRNSFLANFERMLYTLCAVIRLLASANAKILLQRIEEIKENKPKKLQGIEHQKTYALLSNSVDQDVQEKTDDTHTASFRNAMSFALSGNSAHYRVAHIFSVNSEVYKIKNKLLTTFVEAAVEGNVLIDLLLQRDAEDFTPLLYTVYSNDIETSLYLVEQTPAVAYREIHGAVVSRRYDDEKKAYVPLHKSVLMYAVENQLFEVVEALKLNAVQWRATTATNDSAFHFAAKIVSAKTIAYFEFLKEKDVPIQANSSGQYPLHIAVQEVLNSSADVLTEPVEWLVNNGPGLYELDNDGRLPLHYAFVRHGDLSHRDTSTIDPICIVSLLEHSMEREKVDCADKLGNTPLHYAASRGAIVCVVTLLSYGCNPKVTNCDGNTPLALAVLYKKKDCALTLIQAKSGVIDKVYIRLENDAKEENQDWVWIPNRCETQKKFTISNILRLVVRNGWEGIIYIVLDVIGKTIENLEEFVRAALEYKKYNLAQTLLRMLARAILSENGAQKMEDRLDLFLVFVKNLPSTVLDATIKKVFDQLTSLKIKWYAENADICRSPVIEHLARHGHFQMLDAIYEYDQLHDKKWMEIEYLPDNNNPLVGIIETCIRDGISEGALKWLKEFGKRFGVNTLMCYVRPFYEGIIPWKSRKPECAMNKMTPLIRAIQCRKVDLIRFLLHCKEFDVDINCCDEFGLTPLMHACIVNSEEIVRLLFDPDCVSSDAKPASNKSSTSCFEYGRKRKLNQEINGIGRLFVTSSADVSSTSTSTMRTQNNERGSLAVTSKSPIKLHSKLDIGKIVSSDKLSHLGLSKTSGDKNFIHFMLMPCGWENVELLKALCKGTPEVSEMITDCSAKVQVNPLMEARRLYQAKMVEAMVRITKSSKVDLILPCWEVSTIKTKWDVLADSEAFLANYISKNAERERAEFLKSRLRPHRNSGFENTGEICVKTKESGEEGYLFKVLLTKTDVHYGIYGFHNYYHMEMIKRRGTELYVLFTNWGRIGDKDGQYQVTPFSSFAEADKEFCSIFKAKSGNDFSNLEGFVEKPNKYRLLAVDEKQINKITDMELKFEELSLNLKERLKKDPVYALIKDIANIERLQQRTRFVCSYTTLQVPFGRLSQKNILEARDVLSKLRQCLIDLKKMEKSCSVDEILPKLREQAAACNEFYNLMPLGGFENTSLPIINTEQVLSRFEKIVNELLEFEIAGRLITAALQNVPHVDPYSYILDSLECDIQLMNSDEAMAQNILQYIQNSSSVMVKGIFTVKSKEANTLFNDNALNVKNHMYLWHGTKSENLLSILKLGLLAAPSSAVQTGQMFGQGIYFADMFTKSEQYCTASPSGMKYALLCQVALGKVRCEFQSTSVQELPYGFDTLKVQGCEVPDPLYDLTLTDGVILPIGPVTKINSDNARREFGFNPCMAYNEYIVPDKACTVVRYVVAFK